MGSPRPHILVMLALAQWWGSLMALRPARKPSAAACELRPLAEVARFVLASAPPPSNFIRHPPDGLRNVSVERRGFRHDLTLPNRIVLSPMTRSRAGAARLANQVMAEY
jgi:hypothetical protein